MISCNRETRRLVAIYGKAYRQYRSLLSAGVVDEACRREVMVMLVAIAVEFDREQTAQMNRQPRALVDKVFDNMERNGLWTRDVNEGVVGEGALQTDAGAIAVTAATVTTATETGRLKWGFEEQSMKDHAHFAVELALHVMVARGEVVVVGREG